MTPALTHLCSDIRSLTMLIPFSVLVPGFILESVSSLVPLGPGISPCWVLLLSESWLRVLSVGLPTTVLFTGQHVLPLHWATPAVSFLLGHQRVLWVNSWEWYLAAAGSLWFVCTRVRLRPGSGSGPQCSLLRRRERRC